MFSHALLSNQVRLEDESSERVEDWVQRIEAAAQNMLDAAYRMNEAAMQIERAGRNARAYS